jgi:hypothetical protein
MRDERQPNDPLRPAEPVIAPSPDRASQMTPVISTTPELFDVAELTLS